MRVRHFLLLGLLGFAGDAPVSAGDEPPPPPAEFAVVGYLPDYRAAEFDPAAARRLTDLIVFSAEPTADGGLDLPRLKSVPWGRLRSYKTRERVRLVLCVGGWERSANFAAAVRSADRRKAFVRAAVRVCLDERLGGLDLDWEHPKSQGKRTQSSRKSRKSCSRKDSSHPAFRRLFLTPGFAVAFFSMARAIVRTRDMFSGPSPSRNRWSSSPNATFRMQWHWFSMDPCVRTARKNAFALPSGY